MRTLLATTLLLGIAAVGPAASLKEARTRWLKGNYEEAAGEYAKLLKDAKTRGAAAVGLSRALASQGEYDKALQAVDDALKALPKEADLLARRAELLHFRGRWDEALKAADAALVSKKKHLPALWVRAQVLRDQGDLKKAEAAVDAILAAYNDTVDTPNEITDPDQLLIVGLATAEVARWNGHDDDFKTVLGVFGDTRKNEKDYWPGELQAGLLLLEKYNQGEALDALDKALKLNPSASEALVARGAYALQRFEFTDAERFAERALKFNPRLPEALRLRADVHMATGNFPAAVKEIKQALATNPRDELALARLGAAAILQGEPRKFDDALADVKKFTRAPAAFFYEVARKVEERRRYDLAEKYYREALKLRPNHYNALNGLGMLLLRLGQEQEGRKLLERGFKLDPFNVRVLNMRKVMDHLDKYKEVKTEHFIVRYDEKSDAVLAKYMALELEKIYDELKKKFDYGPRGPILVEVFRSHTMFSGRTVALPDLHTIGACTGRVVTMVSPNEKTAGGKRARAPFNWMRVLRHEVVHIFNLAQTNYLVPHWFTEGLAVDNEGFPRPPSWNLLLARQLAADDLLNLDTIDLAFIRPRSPLQWQQAYLQANLYVQYIEKEYGKSAIGKLLAAFAKGDNAATGIKNVCKVSKGEFEKGYRKYLREVVKELGIKDAGEKKKSLKALRAEFKKDPNDADLAAEIAYRVVGSRRIEARKLAEQALEKKKDHPKALYVLAKLAERAADDKARRKYLEQALDTKDPFPPVVKELGKLYYEGREVGKAIEMFELGRKAEPFDATWLMELQRAYAQQDNKSKLIGVLKELVPLEADNLDWRNRLARLLLEKGKSGEAELYARKALEIDITSPTAREVLYKALKAQKKNDELERMEALLGPVKEKKD